jgi:AcrR family transcriptional regulator
MVAAMVDVAAERGIANATVAHVVTRSGVSRRTFYEIFNDSEHCFLAAFDEAVARAGEYVISAYEQAGDGWREKVRAGLAGLLSFLDDQPNMGRLLIVESLGAGPAALARRGAITDQLIAAIDAGRNQIKGSRQIPALTAEGIVGAVLAVLHARLIEPRHDPLIDLTSSLMGMIVLPYQGGAAAEKEITRPTPQPHDHSHHAANDPLRDLEMRLTYRTMRVLIAIGEQPGASNRDIGLQAGIEDQGQISKLLARLQRLALITNTGEGQARGAPNAWTLTTKGTEIQNLITQQASTN